jgi:hypothetical protein
VTFFVHQKRIVPVSELARLYFAIRMEDVWPALCFGEDPAISSLSVTWSRIGSVGSNLLVMFVEKRKGLGYRCAYYLWTVARPIYSCRL